MALCFCLRLGFSGRRGKPPVERGSLRGEVDEVRDRVSEASVCAGDTSLDCGAGGSSTGAGSIEALEAGAGAGLPATFFRG